MKKGKAEKGGKLSRRGSARSNGSRSPFGTPRGKGAKPTSTSVEGAAHELAGESQDRGLEAHPNYDEAAANFHSQDDYGVQQNSSPKKRNPNSSSDDENNPLGVTLEDPYASRPFYLNVWMELLVLCVLGGFGALLAGLLEDPRNCVEQEDVLCNRLGPGKTCKVGPAKAKGYGKALEPDCEREGKPYVWYCEAAHYHFCGPSSQDMWTLNATEGGTGTIFFLNLVFLESRFRKTPEK